MTRIACVQCDVAFGDASRNAAFAHQKLEGLADSDVVVFPEAFLTGYVAASRDEAVGIALPYRIDDSGKVIAADPLIEGLAHAARRWDTVVVAGFIGRQGDSLANCALIAMPHAAFVYRKTHLPVLGVDRFVEPGTSLPVFDAPFGRFGALICFDQRLPEPTRTLALRGAQLVVLPTNWPVGAEVSARHICIARAAENRIYLASCNRVGVENGTTFIGESGVYDIDGRVLARAEGEPADLVVEVDLSLALEKRRVVRPG